MTHCPFGKINSWMTLWILILYLIYVTWDLTQTRSYWSNQIRWIRQYCCRHPVCMSTSNVLMTELLSFSLFFFYLWRLQALGLWSNSLSNSLSDQSVSNEAHAHGCFSLWWWWQTDGWSSHLSKKILKVLFYQFPKISSLTVLCNKPSVVLG